MAVQKLPLNIREEEEIQLSRDSCALPDEPSPSSNNIKKVANFPRKRSFPERFERFFTRLSTRSNFWHRVCSWIWLPAAYRSGIRMRRHGNTFSAVLPFRRFNRNWYKAMAGAALLANSEIAGGMYVFNECGGDFGVVCKNLEYRFLRPCVGPAIYHMTPREDIKDLAAGNSSFNITLDMEIVQIMRGPGEKERSVGRCVATFHATSIAMRQERQRIRKQRARARATRGA